MLIEFAGAPELPLSNVPNADFAMFSAGNDRLKIANAFLYVKLG
jgi:hypothetical protein